MRMGGPKIGRAIGQMERTTTVDPIVVNGQMTFPTGETVTGSKPPLIPASWWPWIIAAGALGVAWWYVEKGGGGRARVPLDG